MVYGIRQCMDPNWTQVWCWRYGLLQGLAPKRNSVPLGLKKFATGINSPLPRADRLFMWSKHRHRRLCFTIQKSVPYLRYHGAHICLRVPLGRETPMSSFWLVTDRSSGHKDGLPTIRELAAGSERTGGEIGWVYPAFPAQVERGG